jgi:hypothetical protein
MFSTLRSGMFAVNLMVIPATLAAAQTVDSSICQAGQIQSNSLSPNGASIYTACSKTGPFAEQFCAYLCIAIASDPAKNPNERLQALHHLQSLQTDPDLFVNASLKYIARAKLQKMLSDFENLGRQSASSAFQAGLTAASEAVATKATVVQTGSDPQSSGSTDLVAKPTTTDLISVAAESGAFADTSSGTTTTISANLEGLRRLLYGETFSSEPTTDVLRHLTVKATFNIAQPSSSQSAIAAPANSGTPVSITSILLPVNSNLSFNSIAAGFVVHRKVDPLSKDFQTKWLKAVSDAKSELDKETTKVLADYKTIFVKTDENRIWSAIAPAVGDWKRMSGSDISKSDFDKLIVDFEAYAEFYEAEAEKENDELLTEKAAALLDHDALDDSIAQIFDQARGNLLTVQFSYSTQPSKPATNDVTLAYAYVTKKSGFQINANGFGSWYASVPAGAKYGRFRAYQFSTEIDKPVGPTTSPRAILSLAAYGQNQSDKTVINISAGNLAPGTSIPLPSDAQVLLGTSGWLGVGQAKVVFNLPKANGLSIPIAFKWSSKTDLRSGGDWRGQFGVSYDFSAISSLIMGKSSQ